MTRLLNVYMNKNKVGVLKEKMAKHFLFHMIIIVKVLFLYL